MATTSATGAVSTAGITSPSIDVAGIVSGLIAVEQQPITQLNNQITSYQSKISALGTIQASLVSFQTAALGLSSNTFNTPSATSSNTSAFTATATATATPGNYSLAVSQLAQAQSIVATGQASANTAIGNGTSTTLTFNFGTISGGTLSGGVYSGATFTGNGSTAKTVTIDSSNNTLTGIRDAINAANIGVTATIINDGTASPYRLVLTSSATGAANSMQISVSGDASLSSLLSYDPAGTQNLTQSSAAQNASLTVNGIAVSKSSNAISDVIQGVTLNLAGTTTGSTLTVANDVQSVTTSINTFVQAYNSVVNAVQAQTSYDPTTKVAGTLQGDVSLSILQSQMAALIGSNIGNNPNGYSNLAQIGIGFQKDGTLAVDTATLNSALNSNYQGVASLFVAAGTSSDSLISYNSATSSTKAGNYAVNITQLATQGTAAGNTAAGLTITTGVNDTLSLSVDGTSTSVVLPAGTYTAASLATQLQTLINSSSPISGAGKSVMVNQNAGVLSITSATYGSGSSVTISGGNGSANLFGTPTSTAGLDVAGTINNATATGSGQILTSSAGDSIGLSVVVKGGTTGSRGAINYTQGLSSMFNSWTNTALSSSGPLSSETTQYNTTISDIQKQISDLNTRIAADQINLTNQYSQLDAMLGSMNSLSSYLTQQLSRLP